MPGFPSPYSSPDEGCLNLKSCVEVTHTLKVKGVFRPNYNFILCFPNLNSTTMS